MIKETLIKYPNYKPKRCRICGDIFYVAVRNGRRLYNKPFNARQKHSVTCSKECSDINTDEVKIKHNKEQYKKWKKKQ